MNKERKTKIIDTLLVSGFFLSLLPIRMAFIEFVGDNWLGSFGLLTAISVTVLVLIHKKKMGFFGRSFNRYFKQRHKKKKIILITQFTIAIVWVSIFIYSVEYVNNNFEFEKEEIIALLPQTGMDSTEEISRQAVEQLVDSPHLLIVAFIGFIYTFFFQFDYFALALWTINEITDGFYLDLATVILVEEIEIVGLFILYHVAGKKFDT